MEDRWLHSIKSDSYVLPLISFTVRNLVSTKQYFFRQLSLRPTISLSHSLLWLLQVLLEEPGVLLKTDLGPLNLNFGSGFSLAFHGTVLASLGLLCYLKQPNSLTLMCSLPNKVITSSLLSLSIGSKIWEKRKVIITVQKLRKPEMEPLSLWKKQHRKEVIVIRTRQDLFLTVPDFPLVAAFTPLFLDGSLPHQLQPFYSLHLRGVNIVKFTKRNRINGKVQE